MKKRIKINKERKKKKMLDKQKKNFFLKFNQNLFKNFYSHLLFVYIYTNPWHLKYMVGV